MCFHPQVADLKKELKSRGLSVAGTKNELTERLQEALKGDHPFVSSMLNLECVFVLQMSRLTIMLLRMTIYLMKKLF